MDKYIMYGVNFGTTLGELTIDSSNKMKFEFYDNLEIRDLPPYLYEEFKAGHKIVGHDPCVKLFKWLLMPPNRVNIDEELKDIGLKEYCLVEIIKKVRIDFPLLIKLEKIE